MQLHLSPLNNAFLYRVFGDKAENAHLLLLSNSMCPILYNIILYFLSVDFTQLLHLIKPKQLHIISRFKFMFYRKS